MADFGVVKERFKKFVKKPILPDVIINLSNQKPVNSKIATWMNGVLKEPSGDEFSAFGVGFNEGGVALFEIVDNSLLSKAGFKTGDIIQYVNGIKLKA